MPPLRALSLVGNALGLVLLAFLCVRAVPLVAIDERAPPRFESGIGTGSDRAVLLVVIDALRQDTALDASTMPTLAALASRGRHREMRVVQPVPSTVGALPALVEGRAVPANAALLDLTPRPAPGGGLLAALHAVDRPAEIGGTALWDGLYARWLGPGMPVHGMPDAATDAAVMRWALQRLQADDAPSLLVVHPGRLDATAHRHGAGEVYRATARDIDGDVALLIAHARAAGRDVLITSDHGVTRDGGHAGGETSVRAVPLFLPDGAIEVRDGEPQTRFATVLAARLGLAVHPADGALTVRWRGASDVGAGPTAITVIGSLGFVAIVTVLAWSGLSRLSALGTGRGVATGWSAALWACVAVAVALSPPLAAILAAGVLALPHALRALSRATGARIGGQADPRADDAASAHPVPATGWTLVIGASVALVEVVGVVSGSPLLARAALLALLAISLVPTVRRGVRYPPGRSLPEASPGTIGAVIALMLAGGLLGGPALAGVTLLAALGARMLAGTVDSVPAGAACIVALTTLSHLAGESASLSSLDVSLAHHAAASPGGVASAVAVALLRLFWLPGVWVIAWGYRRTAISGDTDGGTLPTGALRGAAQASLASMLVFACLMMVSWPMHAVRYDAALGGLVQEAALWIGLVGTASLAVVLGRRRGTRGA